MQSGLFNNKYLIHRTFPFLASLLLTFGMFACSGDGSSGIDSFTEASVGPMAESDLEAGEMLLFDGETLSGWRGLGRDDVPEGHWSIEDGAIKKNKTDDVPRASDGQPVRGGDLTYDQPFENFELSFEWKVSPGANSGIKYNVSEELSASSGSGYNALGFEYQVLDNDLHPDARNDPNRKAAGLYDLIPPGSNAVLNPVGTWNTGKIVFNGKRGEHWLNGEKVVEYELETHMMNRLLATSKWGDNPDFGVRRKSGYIVLQDHGDDVWYRNLRIRELTP